MAIYSLEDLRRSAPGTLKDASDIELIDAYAQNIGADPREIAQYFGLPTGASRSAFTAGIASGVDQLQGLGYSAIGGAARALGFDTAADWANRQADLQQTESYLAGRPELERVEDLTLGTALPFTAYQIGKQVPVFGTIAAAQLIPGGGQAAAATGLARLGATAPRLIGGGGVEAGASIAARREAIRRGQQFGEATLKGGGAGTALGYGALYQESREGGDESPYLSALGAVPYGLAEAFVPTAVRSAILRGGTGLAGGLPRRVTTAGGLAAVGESLTELSQNELEMLMRDDLSPEEISSRRLNSAVIGGLVGGSVGSLGGIRRGDPTDLMDPITQFRNRMKEADAEARGAREPTQLDLFPGGLPVEIAPPSEIINPYNVGGYVGAQERGLDTSMQFQTPTGQQAFAMGEGPVEQIDTTAPTRAAQQAAQQTQGAQQAAQIEQAVIQQTAQAYGVRQVPPGPGVPTQAFNIAGRTVIGVPRVNQIVREIAQANQNKSPERVQLEAAIVASGLPLSGQATSKSILSSIDGVIKKYQLDGAATLNDAAQVLEFQIGQAKSAKAAEPMARIYEALTGQMSNAFQQLMEGPKPAAAPTTPTAATPTPTSVADTLGLITQPTGAPSGEPTTAGQPTPSTTPTVAGAPRLTESEARTTGRALATVPSGVQQTTELRQAPAAEEVTAAQRQWEDMDDTNTPYSSIPLPIQEVWEQAVANNQATAEVVDAIVAEVQTEIVTSAADRIFQGAINKLYPMEKQQNKARFVFEMLGTQQKNRDKTVKQLAQEYGVSEDTIKKDWNRAVKALYGKDRQKLADAITATMVELRINQDLALQYMQQTLDRIKEVPDTNGNALVPGGAVARAGGGTFAPAVTETGAVIDEQDLADPESAMRASTRKSLSVAEWGNKAETLSAQYTAQSNRLEDVQQQLEEARAEGDQAQIQSLETQVADIETRLEEITAEITKESTRIAAATRATAGKTTEGEPDAVSKRETKKVSVGEGTRGGKKVDKEVRVAKEPTPTETKTEREVTAAPEVTPTTAKTAESAWTELRSSLPQEIQESIPAWRNLTKAQKDAATEFGADLNMRNVERIIQTSGTTRFSMRPGAKGSNAATLRKSVVDFIGADNERKLIVVQTVKDIDDTVVAAVEAETGPIVAKTQGFVHEGKAYLIASNIEPGTERAVFMHEVGAHLGLENILSEQQFDTLVDKILEWSQRTDASLENTIAVKALKRVIDANPPMGTRNTELIAYFIEEAVIAGVDPTAAQTQTGFGSWFRTLWSAFKRAIRRLGFNSSKMDAFDIVNLAYGAARLEIAGTWHGTAAKFRRFDHQFMGKGEGAQAYGWGTYLAQRSGIAYEYMVKDARKKTKGDIFRMLDGYPIMSTQVVWALQDAKKAGVDTSLTWLRSLESEYKKQLEKARSSLAPSGNIGLEDALSVVQRAIQTGGVEYTPLSKAQGSLLRVDVNAQDNELLDWDTPIQDQPEIFKKLKNDPVFQMILNEFDKGAGFTFNSADDLFTSNGSYFYRGLVELVEYGQFSTILDAIDRGDKATQKLKADEVVSAFLDSIGIKGIKFLDASSRIKPKSFYKQQIETLKLLAQAEKETEEAFGIKPKLNPEEFKLRIAEIQEKLEKAPEDYTLTRNIVVFNDKNIFRVASLPEAKREQVKFSIAPAQEFAAQASLSAYQTRRRNSSLNVPGVPETVRSAGQAVFEAISNWTRKGIDRVVFTEALIKRAVESGIPAANEFKNYIRERGVSTRKLEQEVEKIADMYALVPESDRGTKEFSVNTFIYDSTRTKKWGFPPKWRATAVTVDPDMRDRFDALKPESQAFIRAVFQHGDKMLALKKKAVMDFTNSEYDAQIKLAQADGNAELVASLQKDKIADLKKFDTLFKLREGIPYAPLRRVGKYAVVAKSPEFRAAEERGDNKALRLLEQDPNHYHVSFVDTTIQAINLRNQLQEQGFYGPADNVTYFERTQDPTALFGGESTLKALSGLRAKVETEIQAATPQQKEQAERAKKVASELRRLITDMYLHALADASARKSELRRRAVPGEIDMLQSFTLQGRADAHFLSAVQYNDRTEQALRKMAKQAQDGDRNRKSEILNELTGRYLQSLEYQPSSAVQKITRLSSIYFLASSPGYYLQNLTQPWMMSLPVMAGRHDYTKSANALYNAYFDLKEVMKSANAFEQQFDFSKVPDDVKEVIETLVNRSQIDIGLSTEMGEFRIEGQGPVSDRWNKLDKGLRLAVQKVESINRLSTAIAAYRLELAKTGDKAGAIDYASSIINDTHGDYSGFNAPRMFNTNIGKVALQFRKFQLIQLGLIAKLFKNSFGKAVTKEQKIEQAVARKALTYILGQTAVITGIMGMPGAAAIAWALEGLFGDDDEPLDIKGQVRDFIGNDDISNLILYGSPNLAGVNLSGKIGMGNALSVMPFTDIKDINGEKTAQIVGTLLGGPAAGMGMRMADGYAYMAAGDLYKGMELMLPKGVGDAMRGVRIYSEGFTNRRGDELLSADQIGEVTLFWQSLGLSPTQTSMRGEKQARVINLEQKFSDRSSSIKRAYAEAAKSRNNERMAELRADWRNLQEARIRNGYPRRPISELLRAPQEQRQRERQVVGGVPYTESSRRFVERIANQ